MGLLLDKLFLEKVQLVCLSLTILFLPITMLPIKHQIMFIGGNLANYPLFLGLIVFLVYFVKYDVKLPKYMKFYMLIYALWCIVTSIYGTIAYPYYEHINILNSPKIVKILSCLRIDENSNNVTMAIMCVRSLKIAIFEFARTFLITIWVFILFRNRFEYGFLFIRKYFMVLIAFLCTYGIFEVVYFNFDSLWAKEILEKINPVFYDVKSYLGWYPPLIWHNNQVRSFCTEPGDFGAYIALSLPFMWSFACENKKNMYLFYTYIVYLGFATKARTATLFVLLNSLICPFYLFSQNKLKKVFCRIVLATMIGFSLNVVSSTAQEYYEDNIETIFSMNRRSNNSRIIVLKRNSEVIIDNCIMGTGFGFKEWFVKEKMTSEDLKEPEIRKIKDVMEEKGIFTASYSGGYLFTIAINMGLPGLVLYCIPLIFGCYLAVKRKYYNELYVLTVLTILVTLYSRQFICASMTMTYFMLGLLYVALDDRKVEIYLSNE